jgi:hypothetical protein
LRARLEPVERVDVVQRMEAIKMRRNAALADALEEGRELGARAERRADAMLGSLTNCAIYCI